jgi:hypothetical protein
LRFFFRVRFRNRCDLRAKKLTFLPSLIQRPWSKDRLQRPKMSWWHNAETLQAELSSSSKDHGPQTVASEWTLCAFDAMLAQAAQQFRIRKPHQKEDFIELFSFGFSRLAGCDMSDTMGRR